MGQQNSKYGGSQNDPEKGVIPQNTRKIHGLSRILTAKAEHRREIAVQGWDKHDQNMVAFFLLYIKNICHWKYFFIFVWTVSNKQPCNKPVLLWFWRVTFYFIQLTNCQQLIIAIGCGIHHVFIHTSTINAWFDTKARPTETFEGSRLIKCWLTSPNCCLDRKKQIRDILHC